MKIEVYIVHRMDRLLTLFHTTQLKLWDLYILQYFLAHIHINFGHNLTFTLLLAFVDLH